MTRNLLSIIVIAISITAAVNTVHAQGGFPGGRNWAAGVAVVSAPSPFVAHDTQVLPLPILVYQGKRLQMAGFGTRYILAGGTFYSIHAQAGYRFEGFEAEKGSFLNGMAKRDGALELGLGMSLAGGPGVLDLAAMTDVTGTHKGQEYLLTYALPIAGERWSLTPRAGVTLKTGKLADYYYGVRASEALPDRPEYQAKRAFNPTTGIDYSYLASWDWYVISGVEYEKLSDNITGSPIVEDGFQVTGYVAVMRIF